MPLSRGSLLCGLALVGLAGCGGQRLGLPAVPPTPPPPTLAPAIVPETTTVALQPGDGAAWTSQALTITPTSLGTVKVGMTLTQAEFAARVTFGNFGDGYASASPKGNPVLFVGGGVGTPAAPGTVKCVGASLDPARAAGQVVETPEGVHLGDAASRVVAVYGSAAHLVPAPTSGINPVPGYVVPQTTGNLAFVIKNDTVTEIEGGDASLQPSSCTG